LKNSENTVNAPIEPHGALIFNSKILKIFTFLLPDARQEKSGALLEILRYLKKIWEFWKNLSKKAHKIRQILKRKKNLENTLKQHKIAEL
jgi:thiamine kinase-like enzyme